MKESIKSSLNYFKRALELDRLSTVEFSKNNCSFWKSPLETIKAGQLSLDITTEMFESYFSASNVSKTKRNDINSIDLIVALRVIENGNRRFGALNTVCSLSKTGELSADLSNGGPWIPNDRLMTENSEPMDLMVGSLDYFREFERKHSEELESRIETWTDYVDYADEMYDYVASKSKIDNSGDTLEKYLDNVVCIKLGDNVFASGSVISLYEAILRKDCIPPLLNKLLEPPLEKELDTSVDAGDYQIKNICNSCGSMGNEFFLASSQRKAVHAYTRMSNGDILAVSGPPGTGKTTMLQSIVANLITTHAIQGNPAPVIVGSSTNNQAVTNIIESFSAVVPKEPKAYDFRWLVSGNESISTLPSIAAYCPAKSRIAEAEKKGYLVEQKDKSGIYSEYSNENYVTKASDCLLSFSRDYFGQSYSLGDVQKMLHENLKQLDYSRQKFANAVFNLISNSSIDESELRKQIEQASAKQRSAQERLRYWIGVDENRPKKGFFRKKPSSSDEDLIYSNKMPEDFFSTDKRTIEEIKQFYKSAIDEAEKIILESNRGISSYNECFACYQDESEKLKNILHSSVGTPEDLSLEETFSKFACKFTKMPCKNDALLELDRVLDITIRYVEFWLAIHYYECQWLLDCSSQDHLIPREDRWKNKADIQDKYWKQISSLTPCMVMTEYQLPKFFTKYVGKEKPNTYDAERIDLLIVDEAGQVNPSIAIASFALAKKAVVVGDVKQLSPVWSLTSESDKEIAQDNGISTEKWTERGRHGLTSSNPSSLMRTATHACRWRYSNEEAGLFLEEHYRCVEAIIQFSNSLLYNKRLVPSRTAKSALAGKIDPFLFVVVSGSKDVKVGSSRKNPTEAEAITNWILKNKDTLTAIYDKDLKDIVGIVTPFSAQARCIKSVLSRANKVLAKNITIGTAHKLQGAERPVILFSAVYGDSSGDAGFIEKTPELTNVAVSRAKDLFIVFASKARQNDSGPVFKQIIKTATVSDGMLPSVTPSDTDKKKVTLYKEDEPENYFSKLDSQRMHADAPGENVSVIFEGEVGIKELLSLCTKQYLGSTLTAAEANIRLKEHDFIEKVNEGSIGGWRPTAKGLEHGIIEIPPSEGKDYYMCKYTCDAANAILPIIRKRN